MTKASYVVFIDRSWNPEVNRQAILRVRRNGQEHSKVVVYNFKSKNSVDDTVYDRVDYKEGINQMIKQAMENSTRA